jgi:hypothetical protein
LHPGTIKSAAISTMAAILFVLPAILPTPAWLYLQPDETLCLALVF